jgi:hypothetical protein
MDCTSSCAFTSFNEVLLGKSKLLQGPIIEVEQSGTTLSLPADEDIAERESTTDAKATQKLLSDKYL